VEIQRAYRARLKAAGKVVKLVDADLDPGQMQALVVEVCDKLHNVLVKLELRAQDVERLEVRNRFLEAELVRLERELTNKAKDAIVARQQAAKRRDRNSPDRPTTKALMQLSL
jgi:folate-dependent phosphoribosylglycinamide formyltransferase PurN